jgi:hypothetical protein
MKWTKVNRNCVVLLTDLPNIGKAMAEDLRLIGIREPGQLVSRSPYEMYETLCKKTGSRHDPCVLDVFISVTRFMAGEEPRPWWAYTEERKKTIMKKKRSR